MRRRDDAARPERRRHRGGERLGQRQHFRPGPRCGGTVAGDDHEAARADQHRSGPLDVAFVGNRPVQRNAPRLGFDDRRLGGLPQFDHVALQAIEVEMGRARRVGQRGAPRMAQQPRQFAGGVDRGREFRHRLEQRRVRDFLVGVAVLERRFLMAGQRDDRAAPEPGILQAGSEIGGADRLRHAYARPSGDAGIAVRHIGGRLFGMRQDRPDAEIAELQQRAAHHRFNEKDMTHAGAGQRLRKPFRAVHHSLGHHSLGHRPLIAHSSSPWSPRRGISPPRPPSMRRDSVAEMSRPATKPTVSTAAFRKPTAETRMQTLRKSLAPLT